ncbi:CBO0543 family protein [Bacillus nitroreducens]
MQKEFVILLILWMIGIIGFFALIVRKDVRRGILAFLLFQAVIWFFDMFVFKYGLLYAPVREFPEAHEFPLTIVYFFHPLLFSIFYVYKRLNFNFIYFSIWISSITLFDVVIEHYTDLLEFRSMTWYGLWVYFGFLYYASNICCDWFYKDKSVFQVEKWGT